MVGHIALPYFPFRGVNPSLVLHELEGQEAGPIPCLQPSAHCTRWQLFPSKAGLEGSFRSKPL